LSKWAQLKGVQVVGTGDIAHPGWLQELKEKLEPAEAGLFRLKAEYAAAVQATVPPACQQPVRFLLCGEVSNIYKKHDAVRKIHHLLFMPDFGAVERLQAALEKIGNIRADGRPILGLDSRDLLEITLQTDPRAYLIPAHIWTPWFAILGSKSGFDTIDACFDDLTPHIFALETGLSADPPMCWRIANLDRYTLISNSDAHSAPKLAREATLFDTEFSYDALFTALKTGDPATFGGTLEFFPEEGKYHVDGHRACNIRWEPEETLAHNGLCPVCGKPITVGVMHRVAKLANRPLGGKPPRTHPYHNLIPLPEILAEVYGVGDGAKQVQQSYEKLLSKLGPELAILREIPLDEIKPVGGELLAEGIRRVRVGELTIAAGYDGEYGVIKLFDAAERKAATPQLDLFASEKPRRPARKKSSREEQAPAATVFMPDLFSAISDTPEAPTPAARRENLPNPSHVRSILDSLNPEQRAAAAWLDTPLLMVAGPGTGKTRTLTHRLAYLVAEQGVAPEAILAITFTNKAAEEMSERLGQLLAPQVAARVTIKTFHALGALLLRQAVAQIGLPADFVIASDDDRLTLLKECYPDLGEKVINTTLEQISAVKNQLWTPDSPEALNAFAADFVERYRTYEATLREHQMLDFDDLVVQSVRLLEGVPTWLATLHERYRWLAVDEYQDVNLAQYRLLRLLSAGGANLCAIGDPDQAIYGFRGADRRYFLQFQVDFPQAQQRHLSQNYRSTQLILEAANQVISKSGDRAAALKIWSEFLDQTKVDSYQAPTDKAEAEYVVHQIEQLVGGTSLFSLDSGRVAGTALAGRSFADFAVLYRLGAQSQPLVEAFQRSGIPFQTVGQTPLTEYKEIREILAYLWLIYNPEAKLHLQTIWASASKKQMGQIATFTQQLAEQWQMDRQNKQPVTQIIAQVEQFIVQDLHRSREEKQGERIQQLLRRATPFADQLRDFLEAVALHKETDFYDSRADRVTLMSLHAAKGLEFPVVFIVGCEEQLLPYVRLDKPTDLEEERRLFYVGLTRAQQKLVLTHAKTRLLFGQRMHNGASPFLQDIAQTLQAIQQMEPRKMLKEKPALEQLTLF
jgi:DNA helicase-2/ATP-dependent DNA helicase PcrA